MKVLANGARRRWLIAVLWPSFVLAAVATGLVFATFDPRQLLPFGAPVALGRLAVYSIGFLVLWLYSALSIAAGLLFAAPHDDHKPARDAR